MKMLRVAGLIGLASLLGLFGQPQPLHAAAIDLTQVDFEFDGSPWTLGWKFTVNAPSLVTSLGVYDSGQDGLGSAAEVGLWLATGGEPLAQATVPSDTAAVLDGYFRFTPIAPLLLTPGVEYLVGSYLPGDLATALFGGNGLVDPRVNVIDVRYSSSLMPGFSFPDTTDPGTDGAAFLGGNVQLAPVPVPAAAWLFTSGLAGLAGWCWRRRTPRG